MVITSRPALYWQWLLLVVGWFVGASVEGRSNLPLLAQRTLVARIHIHMLLCSDEAWRCGSYS